MPASTGRVRNENNPYPSGSDARGRARDCGYVARAAPCLGRLSREEDGRVRLGSKRARRTGRQRRSSRRRRSFFGWRACSFRRV